MHVHQPKRIRPYTVFETANDHNYFDNPTWDHGSHNRRLFRKVAEKSYLPTNAMLLDLLNQHPEFRFSLSITGTLIEQAEMWGEDVLESFKRLTDTGRVEIVAETYYHSLAFFYSKSEFEAQVVAHKQKIQELFGQTPQVFRNTELAYNNDLAYWADQAGYKGILSEGWEPVLGWRSPNFVYRPSYTNNIRLLLKNYKLSDDVAFRFSNQGWEQWPLTADKYTHWLNAATEDQPIVNLFMDYETFGEHQWEDTGVFEFFRHLPAKWLEREGNDFATVSEAIVQNDPVDFIDTPQTITWADTERDLTAWLGNSMQQEALKHLYDLEERILKTGDDGLIADWRNLQTSDHVYYMCTKLFTDGDVHAYFSPYDSPYDAFLYFMNVLRDVRWRLSEHEKGSWYG
ncbi:MAG: glycoside hydrolase family 57 protein [Patescibacteria group bacterium]